MHYFSQSSPTDTQSCRHRLLRRNRLTGRWQLWRAFLIEKRFSIMLANSFLPRVSGSICLPTAGPLCLCPVPAGPACCVPFNSPFLPRLWPGAVVRRVSPGLVVIVGQHPAVSIQLKSKIKCQKRSSQHLERGRWELGTWRRAWCSPGMSFRFS